MPKAAKFFILFAVLFFNLGCIKSENPIQTFSVDFPDEENRVTVHKNGEVFLHYGALPQGKIINTGTFNVEMLHNQLQPKFFKNVSREDWLNPKATQGMVKLFFQNKKEKTTFFNEHELVEKIFEKVN